MTQITVGIRELKAQLSHYVQQVKDGATLVITERGRPIGQIVPIKPSVEAQLQELAHTGLVTWNGRKLGAISPPAQAPDRQTVAELLLEDRA
jgi:prevent-host-death family protein